MNEHRIFLNFYFAGLFIFLGIDFLGAYEALRQSSIANILADITHEDINAEIKASQEMGNLRHFPRKPFVVSPTQMVEILHVSFICLYLYLLRKSGRFGE